jgi:hypothetical protein
MVMYGLFCIRISSLGRMFLWVSSVVLVTHGEDLTSIGVLQPISVDKM